MTGELTVYINGTYVPESKAKISVFDHSFLYGDGVFEGIRVEDGGIFAFQEHLTRLQRSARFIGLDISSERIHIETAIIEVIKRNNLRNGYVRPIVTRGQGPMGITRMRELQGPTVLVIPQRHTDSPDLWQHGLAATVVSVRRNPPQCLDPRVKANQYLNNILALLEAWNAGSDVPVILDISGFVSECASENIFTVRDSIVHTPFVINSLDGITRRHVISICSQKFDVVECDMTPYDLYAADEIFAVGSVSLMRPITKIDGRVVGDGKPGPVTKRLFDMLRKKLISESHKVFQ